ELSLGNGQFTDPKDFTGFIHANPLVADPGDGTQDVFAVDQAGDMLWRKGLPQAPGSFEPPITINAGFPSRDLAFIPTHQGALLASVNLRDDMVSLYAYGNGQFLRVGSLATGLLPAQIVAADLTGDGNVDLLVRNAGDGTVSVYLGDGNGGFARLADV